MSENQKQAGHVGTVARDSLRYEDDDEDEKESRRTAGPN